MCVWVYVRTAYSSLFLALAPTLINSRTRKEREREGSGNVQLLLRERESFDELPAINSRYDAPKLSLRATSRASERASEQVARKCRGCSAGGLLVLSDTATARIKSIRWTPSERFLPT